MSAGEPCLSDTLLAQPPSSSLISLGRSTLRNREVKVFLKLWQLGASWPVLIVYACLPLRCCGVLRGFFNLVDIVPIWPPNIHGLPQLCTAHEWETTMNRRTVLKYEETPCRTIWGPLIQDSRDPRYLKRLYIGHLNLCVVLEDLKGKLSSKRR